LGKIRAVLGENKGDLGMYAKELKSEIKMIIQLLNLAIRFSWKEGRSYFREDKGDR
jgi:hypothetical protein